MPEAMERHRAGLDRTAVADDLGRDAAVVHVAVESFERARRGSKAGFAQAYPNLTPNLSVHAHAAKG